VAASSKKQFISPDSKGVNLLDIQEIFDGNDAKEYDIDAITEFMEADVNPHRVIVDCTSSKTVSKNYERWLSAGINIISPNRNAAAGPLETFQRNKKVQRENNVDWLYESGVGASLPLLSTLRDIMETGDTVNVIRGSVSGTYAYVFNTVSEEVPFSKALEQAVEKSFTENDLREDLGGLDVARKIVILARDIGLDINIEDVEIESLVPDEIRDKEYSEGKDTLNAALIEDLKCLDEPIKARLQAAQANDCTLRYKFVIDRKTRKCKCSLEPVDRADPLFRLKPNENLVAFETDRYITSPLIVKGAAAGPDLAAAGIFADLLRLTRTFASLQI